MLAFIRPNLRFTVRDLSEHKSPTVVAEAIADFIQTSPIADSGRATGIVYWYTRGWVWSATTHVICPIIVMVSKLFVAIAHGIFLYYEYPDLNMLAVMYSFHCS